MYLGDNAFALLQCPRYVVSSQASFTKEKLLDSYQKAETGETQRGV